LSDFHYEKNVYHFENESIIYEIIQNRYDNSGFIPNMNPKCNEAYCTTCKMKPKNINELLNHLKSCLTFRYTLFYEKIPADVQLKIRREIKLEKEIEALQRKKDIEIEAVRRKAEAKASSRTQTINNNVTINNTFNINYIDYLRTGKPLIERLTDEQKRKVISSPFNKVTELINIQYSFADLQNVEIFNRSIYSNCNVYDDGNQDRGYPKGFRSESTKKAVTNVIFERLDDIDEMVHQLRDPVIRERFDKYDFNIRNINDKTAFNNLLKKTVNQIYDLTKIKKENQCKLLAR
jgi:hypothetical protein